MIFTTLCLVWVKFDSFDKCHVIVELEHQSSGNCQNNGYAAVKLWCLTWFLQIYALFEQSLTFVTAVTWHQNIIYLDSDVRTAKIIVKQLKTTSCLIHCKETVLKMWFLTDSTSDVAKFDSFDVFGSCHAVLKHHLLRWWPCNCQIRNSEALNKISVKRCMKRWKRWFLKLHAQTVQSLAVLTFVAVVTWYYSIIFLDTSELSN